MLASVLPGFREVRAPLVAGYLWLFAAWLIVDPQFQSREQLARERGETLLERLYTLDTIVQGVGVVVVLSVAAYLVGSLLIAVLAALVAPAARRLRALAQDESGGRGARISRALFGVSPQTQQGLRSWAASAVEPARAQLIEEHAGKLTNRWWHDTYPDAPPSKEQRDVVIDEAQKALTELDGQGLGASSVGPDAVDWVIHESLNDRELLKRQLLVANPLLFGEVDRNDSEATFRFAIAAPVAVISAWLAATESPAWGLGLIVAGALVAHGIRLSRGATSSLAVALRAEGEKLAPPALPRLEAVLVTRFDEDGWSYLDKRMADVAMPTTRL